MVDAAPKDATVVRVTENAPWLPDGGRAEAFRGSTLPRPMSVVRLFIRRADEVFCLIRPDTGLRDLPMRMTEEGDGDGLETIRALVATVTGTRCKPTFVGAVRNIVETEAVDYPWPTPVACFGVWTVEAEPAVEGTWLRIDGECSPLREKHWFPIVSVGDVSPRLRF
jgi:hypothetical protein